MAEIGAGDATPSKKVKLEHGVLEMPNLPDVKKILLDRALQALDDDVLFGFNLLKITNSNAEMCVPFKNSFVKIERSSDPDPKQLITQRKIVYNFAGVFEKGVEILRLYLKDPKKIPEDKEVRLALLRLTSTILKIEGNKDNHESLDLGLKLAKKLRSPEKKRETMWCISLVHHLLKELSVNQHYKLDMFSKFKKYYCCCCQEPIGSYGQYDDCSLGNSEVWHGNVDVLLGPHPGLAVYAKEDVDVELNDSDRYGSLSSFEVKDSIDLVNDRSQIISEAIVFAFLQKKCNPAFDNYLIPTVGISKNDILFYMYDPEHDILLESPPFDLFEFQTNALSYPAVLALWFILNYKTFCTGITEAMKERNFTADFLSRVNCEVRNIYKEGLQFRDCGVGSQKSFYYKPIPGQGWEMKKSRPFKRSLPADKS